MDKVIHRSKVRKTRREAFSGQTSLHFEGTLPTAREVAVTHLATVSFDTPPIQSFDRLETLLAEFRTADRERRLSDQAKINKHDMARLVIDLANSCPQGLKDGPEIVRKLRKEGALLNQATLLEVPYSATIKKPPIQAELGEINGTLNTAVVHAAAMATMPAFSDGWQAGKADESNARALMPLARYAQQIERAAALSSLQKKFSILRRTYHMAFLTKAEEATYKQSLAEAIDGYFSRMPAEEDASLYTTKETLLDLRSTLAHALKHDLFDPLDLKLMTHCTTHHFKGGGTKEEGTQKGLIPAYNESVARTPEVLDKPLNDGNHPMHTLAHVLYAARWAHLAEMLQHEIQHKYVRILPGMPPARGLSL